MVMEIALGRQHRSHLCLDSTPLDPTRRRSFCEAFSHSGPDTPGCECEYAGHANAASNAFTMDEVNNRGCTSRTDNHWPQISVSRNVASWYAALEGLKFVAIVPATREPHTEESEGR